MASSMHRAPGLLALCLVYMCLMKTCRGFCFTSPIVLELTEYQRLRHFCVYNQDGATVNLLPGSRLYTTDCLECSCDEDGLQCCGFGYKAGVVHMPGCVEKRDGCSRVFVKAENQSLDCDTGKPVNMGPPRSPHPDNLYSIRTEERRNKAKQPAPKPAPPVVASSNTVPATRLSPSAPPIKDQLINNILTELIVNARRRPYFHHVTGAQQVPVHTSHPPVAFQNEASSQDAGWLPWLFFLN